MGRTAIAVAVGLAGVASCAFDPRGLRPGENDSGLADDDAAGDDGPAIDAAATPIDAPQSIDARVIDAAPTCPPTGYSGAYRYIAAPAGWLAQEHDCEDDLPGHTHLAVIDNIAEGGVVIGVLAPSIVSGREVWIGVVRDPASPDWRWVTGGAAAYLPWGFQQPASDQVTVRVDKLNGGYFDRAPTDLLPALCECDAHAPVNADYDPGTP